MRAADPDIMLLAAVAMVYGVARMFVEGVMANEGIDDAQAEQIAEKLTAQLGIGLQDAG